ncbi:hypothetical protein ACN47E_005480 [Coniothyrium glycines]
MRFELWDVILFPQDSPIPTQEFKTTCYTPQDESLNWPIVTSYITSHPPGTPFRISIHSWAPAEAVPFLLERRRKADRMMIWSIEVIVDGNHVFRGEYADSSKWPQEITHENRSLLAYENATNEQRTPLRFPVFNSDILKQHTWNAGNNDNRIKVRLLEQIISTEGGDANAQLLSSRPVACFSFQHAPLDILEQAGISWPIRNPLYQPSSPSESAFPSAPSLPQDHGRKGRPRRQVPDVQLLSMQQPTTTVPAASSSNKLRSHLPPVSQFLRTAIKTNGGTGTRLRDIPRTSFHDTEDAFSVCKESLDQGAENTARSTGMSEHIFAASQFDDREGQFEGHALPPHVRSANAQRTDLVVPRASNQRHDASMMRGGMSVNRGRRGSTQTQARQPRDILESVDPFVDHPTAQTLGLYRTASTPPVTWFSAPAMARMSSYPELGHKSRTPTSRFPTSLRPSTSHSQMETTLTLPSQFTTTHAQPSRASTPSLAVIYPPVRAPALHSYNLAVNSPNMSNSRESLPSRSDVQDSEVGPPQENRQSCSQYRDPGPSKNASQVAVSTSHGEIQTSTLPPYVEVIDLDPVETCMNGAAPDDIFKLSQPKITHSSRSSMDSTRRLEKTLFNALDAELGSFEQASDALDMHSELEQVMDNAVTRYSAGDFVQAAGETETTLKRKRAGSLGSEGDVEVRLKQRNAQITDDMKGNEVSEGMS